MAKWRANNGMGSIRQRPDGRWEARYTGPDGRQRSVYAKTEADVTKKLRGQLHEIDTGAWREPSRMTVSEWLEIWLLDYQTATTAQTRDVYETVTRLHVRPVIGTVRLAQLSPMHINRVLSTMRGKGLSARYIGDCRTIMSTAFGCAKVAGIIRANPVDDVKAPRPVSKPLNIVDREHIQAFIANARKRHLGPAIIFLLLTGLRIGEQRGLRWSDVDLDARTLTVERQLILNSSPRFTPPKDGSVRTMHIPPEVIDVLKDQRRLQAAERLAAGSEWHSDALTEDLVFRTAKGHPLASSTIRCAVRAVGVAIGLPELHPHDLRHSYAVAALRAGADVHTVQHNLGHSSAKMTLDVYATYTNDAGIVGAGKLSEYVKNALKIGRLG